jgi:hypothetical protein
MVGAFITEPKGSTWPANGPLMADVMSGSTVLFREFVNVLQNNVYLYGINALPPNNTAKFFNSINYWTNSMAYRFGGQNGINTNLNPNNNSTLSDAFSNTHQVPLLAAGTEWGDPRPVWIAERKKAFRMRWVHPDGLGGFPDDVIKLHGHVYGEEPYTDKSTKIGTNPKNNWTGGREGFGPGEQFDLVIASAGGRLGIPGDFLFASFPAAEQANGNWGLVRVCDPENTQMFPCSASPVPPPMTGDYPAVSRNEAPHDIEPPAKSNERFLLRSHATTEEKPEPKVNVPANTPAPPPPPQQ